MRDLFFHILWFVSLDSSRYRTTIERLTFSVWVAGGVCVCVCGCWGGVNFTLFWL